ncbi:CcdB family protein [Reyranella sp.]|uniref:CcdB family protein n=1 Tax=Reyranella sp. TaxID=1929291 RepID=UPI0025CFAEBA|nr:CcdB family protein [Reyranella sp.]
MTSPAWRCSLRSFQSTRARPAIGLVGGRLMPVVEIGGREFVLLMPSLTNVPVTKLRGSVGDLRAFRDRIVDAIDWTFMSI